MTYRIANGVHEALERKPVRDPKFHDVNSDTVCWRIIPRLVGSYYKGHGDNPAVVCHIKPDGFWQEQGDRLFIGKRIRWVRNTSRES